MSKHWKLLGRAAKAVAWALGLYLDDLCLLGAGVCFTAAAWRMAGETGALISGGACLAVYAVVVARSRRGGGKR